ncbi:radical SAM protein, partial [Candidatus Woesearchaeota archaeon]|nr:radical SAM protein [Candidatus Woesearchaeota archaeon]
MKILFVRPPRYRWPFHSEKSSFWQPLGFASMAAVLRENLEGINLKIIDCPVLKSGWKTTKQMIQREKPDILCVGEETVSAHEALKLIYYTKDLFPGCLVIAGGHHFTYMVNDTLKNHPVDYIVRFEGEMTLLELVDALKKKRDPGVRDLKKIKGIAFQHEGRVIETEIRPLLDMEELPRPAYDLLPMELYGKGASSHKDMVAVEHSRGCNCSCNFCVLWKQMGKIDLKSGTVMPCYRTKSAEKTAEEAIYLAERYRRKTFCWVDPTWNTLPDWNRDFSRLMIEAGKGDELDHVVWLRADYVVRDEQKGIFADQVRAGIRQAMIGIERTDNDDLAYLHKTGYSFSKIKQAFEIVRRYPEVLSVATYIYGIPNETKESLRRFYSLLGKIPFDIGVPLPLTPNPGTRFFEELDRKDLLEVRKFRYYNFVNPIARSKYLTRNQLIYHMFLNEIRIRTRKEQFARSGLKARRRNAAKNLAWDKLEMSLRYARGILQEELLGKVY